MEEIEDPQGLQRLQLPNRLVEISKLVVVEKESLEAEEAFEDAGNGRQAVVVQVHFRQMAVLGERWHSGQQIVIEPQIGQVEKSGKTREGGMRRRVRKNRF